MSRASRERRVLIRTHDLFFRAQLTGSVERAGWSAVTSEDAPVAVVELREESDVRQVQMLVARGIRVVAFGSHVAPQLLRQAREAGAEAVPNSQIVATVQRTLSEV